MKNQITVIIVTYRTSKDILLKCLNSIDKKIKVLIIENSKRFENRHKFSKKFKNLEIICSGSNLGYGNGNNLGLSKVKTKYALILNPDSLCEKNFFTNLINNLKKIKDFHLIGCDYKNYKDSYPAGYFEIEQNKYFENNFKKKKLPPILAVD